SLMLSSEIKVIRMMMGGSAGVSQQALAQYFRWGAVQAPISIYEGVQCLPPGHLLRWSEGDLLVERYFTPEWPGASDRVGGRAALDLTREVVSESVKAHLVSDVPVGVFLSGGLDSTLMAALMKQHGLTDIQAFSIGYEENAGVPDESDAAQRTAEHYGCRFIRERLTSATLFDKLDGYFSSLDQPTGDALNTWLVSQVAAQHVKVTLSGLGADEWFGGYNYHRLLHLARLLPVGRTPLGLLTGPLASAVNSLLPAKAQGHKAWKALFYASGAGGRNLPEMHASARSIFSARETAHLIGCRPSEAESLSLHNEIRDVLVASLDERAPESWLHQLLLLETETYLPNTLLRDNDVTSMAHSLELRVPLVDPKVFELAGKIRPASKLSLKGGKRNLRAAFHDILPEWITHDTRKKTFTLPLMKWMRDESWKERISDTLHSHRCRERGMMNPKQVAKHLDAYYGTDLSDKRAWRLSQSVWLMFVLESWAARQAEQFKN
ncbi:MAG TPA: asparagine synthase C-terminal domain-containing protein, partial [Verrucomicrobium sp.]|nr:asparagine synthase C-terminal domain-containing protein [Verrucomicrobium sp.]